MAPSDLAGAAVVTWSATRVIADGTTIHVHRTGTVGGRPIVLAHGFTDNGRCWRSTIEALGDGYDIIAPGTRHHGHSDSPTDDSPTDEADDLITVIETLELDRPTLIGHSHGARTMAEVAGRRRDLVRTMLLEDPPWRAVDERQPNEPMFARRRLRRHLQRLAAMTETELFDMARRDHPDWPPDEYPEWVAAKQQVRPAAARMLAIRPWGPIVDGVDCPTLLLHGEPARGSLTSPEVAVAVERRNPLITTQAVPNAGHNLRRENRVEWLTILRSFLDGTGDVVDRRR